MGEGSPISPRIGGRIPHLAPYFKNRREWIPYRQNRHFQIWQMLRAILMFSGTARTAKTANDGMDPPSFPAAGTAKTAKAAKTAKTVQARGPEKNKGIDSYKIKLP